MKGRPPVSAAVKRLSGNPGKRAIRDDAAFESRVPRCPAHLTAEARREWRRVVRELAEAGLLTTVDRAALACYCQAWADWVDAQAHIDEGGRVCTSETGYQYQSPWVSIAKNAMEQMRRFMTEFGMTPSSRSRVHPAEAETADQLEAFVRRRRPEGKDE